MTEIPQTQKAVFQPDVQSTDLTIIHDHPVPTPAPSTSEHLIRVHTAAITNGELLWMKNFPPAEDPNSSAPKKILVPCFDVAGTVVTAPPSSSFPPGTEVYARSDYIRTGCARAYTILLKHEMSIRPHRMSWAESATVPMSAETAWQALFVHAGLEAAPGSARGKRIFVNAASGGVGVWTVQLAKWAGAEVIATCGEKNFEWVRSLGADEVLDRETDFKEWAGNESRLVDVAIDCIGRKSCEDAWWVTKEGGQLVSVYQPPEAFKPGGLERNIKSMFFIMKTDGEQLQRVTDLINQGGWKTAMDSSYPVDQFQEAFAKVASGRTRGKVVLDLGA